MLNKKNFCITLLVSITVTGLFSQTNIPGGVVSGTWIKENSPYLIEGAIMVEDGSTLTIEPGVKIEFQGSYKFLVLGQLLAMGEKKDSIRFTCSSPETGWLGVIFENASSKNDSSKFLYCVFTHTKPNKNNSDYEGSAIYSSGFSKVRISHSRISYCNSKHFGAVDCGATSIVITNNTFSYNSEGAIYINCFGATGPKIVKNYFYKNSGRMEGGAIRIVGTAIIDQNIFVENNNRIEPGWLNNNFGGGAINIGLGSYATISNNIFIGNTCPNAEGGAIAIWGNESDEGAQSYGGTTGTSITNNIFAFNTAKKGGAIASMGNNPYVFHNNTFTKNSSEAGGAMYMQSDNFNIINSIFWHNSVGNSPNQIHLANENCDPNIYNCIFQGAKEGISTDTNSFYLGNFENNIDLDPLFSRSIEDNQWSWNLTDWDLQENSPCIDAGKPGTPNVNFDINGNSRIYNDTVDIGAFEYIDDFVLNLNNRETPQIKIYPNPATELLTISGINPETDEISIFNSTGSTINYDISSTNIESITLDTGSLPKGIYFVKVKGSTVVSTKIIIVE